MQYLEVKYEELLQDPAHFEVVPTFLGVQSAKKPVPSQKKSSQTVRLHPKSCSEKVENWDEVAAFLKKKGKGSYVDMCLPSRVDAD